MLSCWFGRNVNFDVAELSLKNSVFAVTVKDRDKVIGMGRIVGDGAIYFYIQDVIVHPRYRGMGMGKEIMNRLVEYLKENAPNKAFIGLFRVGRQMRIDANDLDNYIKNNKTSKPLHRSHCCSR